MAAPRRRDWSDEENLLIVADYFDMLEREARGEPYVKRRRNAALRARLDNRSHGSVEFKHQNISAILHRLGLRFIKGYLPAKNAQGSLEEPIRNYLESHPEILELFEHIALEVPTKQLAATADREVPKPPASVGAAHWSDSLPLIRKRNDYAAMDARNRSLGLRGEEFVVEGERRRLTDAGRRDLARAIVHVSQAEGDGPGYDIRSFEPSGKPKLIEVKTTNHGERLPFILTRNELRVSGRHAESYRLYRVFDFSRDPRFFVLHGSMADACLLVPKTYLAKVV